MQQRSIVVTFAARYGIDLAGIVERDGSVGLPAGMSGLVTRSTPPAFRAVTPDQWGSFIQIAVQVESQLDPVIKGMLATWLYERLKASLGHKLPPPTEPDALPEVRVFVGHFEVDPSDRAAVEEALASANGLPREELPPQLVPRTGESSRPPLTDEEWLSRQLEVARRYQEDMARRLAVSSAQPGTAKRGKKKGKTKKKG